jgi:hypothetical protein
MANKNMEFLVSLNGKSPKNLADSIRRVKNTSAGFVQSWLASEIDEAYETSQEAFEHIEYIVGEIRRQRDVHKQSGAGWGTSAFKAALDVKVGKIVEDVTEPDTQWFCNLAQGQGTLPPGISFVPLSLGVALNKLMHRHTTAVNFSVVPNHTLFLITQSGMGQAASLSEIPVLDFCRACETVAGII